MDRRAIRAWCMYDWANSAFATTVMAALFPPFYRAIAVRAGLSGGAATACWGYTAAAALLLAAVMAPVLGAVADYTGKRKRYLACFLGLGLLATAGCAAVGTDRWVTASLVYIAGNIGFAAANIFYESFLPHIAGGRDMDRVSSLGYALGYAGGGILLILNTVWVVRPAAFGLPGRDAAIRVAFLSAAVWWGVFSIPLFRRVPEPPGDRRSAPGRRAVREGFLRVAGTLRHVRRYRQLSVFLLAFWVYNDGIGTIIKMATAYGDEIGIGVPHMMAALILTQCVGVPCTLLFGLMAGRLGAKRCLYLALGVYAAISAFGYFMKTATHFYLLALAVGTVQGGSQALSRSLFASMVPKHKAAEFFGFFSTSAKFAGIAGPLVFAVVSHATGRSRLSIAALVLFFLLGAGLLRLVDVEQGRRAARDG